MSIIIEALRGYVLRTRVETGFLNVDVSKVARGWTYVDRIRRSSFADDTWVKNCTISLQPQTHPFLIVMMEEGAEERHQ